MLLLLLLPLALPVETTVAHVAKVSTLATAAPVATSVTLLYPGVTYNAAAALLPLLRATAAPLICRETGAHVSLLLQLLIYLMMEPV